MPALSIQQPWAYAILYLGKPAENRTWYTHVRGRVQIHAGKKIDQDGVDWLRLQGYDIPDDLPTGAFLGEVTITGCCQVQHLAELSEWAFGPYCFLLADPQAYPEPIPGRGALKFFEGCPVPVPGPKVYSLRRGAPVPPPGAVYVGRGFWAGGKEVAGSDWGNPFVMNTEADCDRVCDQFEAYALERPAKEPGWLDPLRGKGLTCWCAPLRCHADTLLRLANREGA